MSEIGAVRSEVIGWASSVIVAPVSSGRHDGFECSAIEGCDWDGGGGRGGTDESNFDICNALNVSIRTVPNIVHEEL